MFAAARGCDDPPVPPLEEELLPLLVVNNFRGVGCFLAVGDFEPPMSFSFFDRAMRGDNLSSCPQCSKFEVLFGARSNVPGRFGDYSQLLFVSRVNRQTHAVTFFRKRLPENYYLYTAISHKWTDGRNVPIMIILGTYVLYPVPVPLYSKDLPIEGSVLYGGRFNNAL